MLRRATKRTADNLADITARSTSSQTLLDARSHLVRLIAPSPSSSCGVLPSIDSTRNLSASANWMTGAAHGHHPNRAFALYREQIAEQCIPARGLPLVEIGPQHRKTAALFLVGAIRN